MSIQQPTDDFELLLHVAEDPERYLGRRAIGLFEAFARGYQSGFPAGSIFRWLAKPEFEDLVRKRFPVPERWPPHLSAVSFVDFLGHGDADAFAIYVDLCREYFATHAPVAAADAGATTEHGPPDSLLKTLESICQRPAMYLGNSDQMGCLVAFLNGRVEAERIHAGTPETESLLKGFQAWLNARHPWALGRPWHRILLFQNLWAHERAIGAFWTHLDMFQRGEPPDALTPVGRKLFDKGDAENFSEEELKDREKQFNRIFYTK